MPPLPRIVFVLFLGVAGLVLWLGGLVYMVDASILAFVNFWPDGLLSQSISAVVASIGFIMFSCARLMTADEALRIPLRHLPAMIAFQLAAMISGVIASASFSVTITDAIWGNSDWRAPVTGIISILILATLLYLHRGFKKWNPETAEEKIFDDRRADSDGPSNGVSP